MAVAVESAASQISNISSNTSITYALTVTSGTAVVVGVTLRQGNTCSSVTYAGSNLTQLGAVTNGTDVRVELWGIVSPATGANNVVVTHTATGSNGRVVSGAVSLTGTDTSSPFGTPVTATGNSTSPSVSVTSGSNDMVVDTLSMINSTVSQETATVGASQTQRWNQITANGTSNIVPVGAGSTEAGAGGSTTMSWTLNNIVNWAQAGVNVAAPTAGPSINPIVMII